MKNLKKYILLIPAYLFLFPSRAMAQVSLPDELRPDYLPTIEGSSAEEQVTRVAGDFLTTMMQIIGGLAVIFIIIAAFRYATSLGNEEGISKAKKALIWIIAGLILLFTALVIIRFVVQVALVTQEVS